LLYNHRASFLVKIAMILSLQDMVPVFSKLTPMHACYLIIDYWLPQLYSDKADIILLKSSFRSEFGSISRWRPYREPITRPTDPFADIIITLRRVGLNYRAPLAAIVELCRALFQDQGIFQLFRTWRNAGIVIFSDAVRSVLQEVSAESPETGLAMLRAGRLYISHCPELLLALIKKGTHSAEIFRIMKYWDPTSRLPVSVRIGTRNNLHELRNTLVHMAADTFSRYQGDKSTRTTFRNVEICYKYLLHRDAPLHPLMGRALVRAGIIRPLGRMEWVPTERIRYILDVVRKLEGNAVAHEIDTAVWTWRGKIQIVRRSQATVTRAVEDWESHLSTSQPASKNKNKGEIVHYRKSGYVVRETQASIVDKWKRKAQRARVDANYAGTGLIGYMALSGPIVQEDIAECIDLESGGKLRKIYSDGYVPMSTSEAEFHQDFAERSRLAGQGMDRSAWTQVYDDGQEPGEDQVLGHMSSRLQGKVNVEKANLGLMSCSHAKQGFPQVDMNMNMERTNLRTLSNRGIEKIRP
jgi:hypothetical protein